MFLSCRFTFTHIYGPSTSQKDVFEESTLGLVNDFVKGQSILLFTYGATNSGKTFTVQGKEPSLMLLRNGQILKMWFILSFSFLL